MKLLLLVPTFRPNRWFVYFLFPVRKLNPITPQAYFLKYDSVHGKFKGTVSSKENNLFVEGKKIHVFNETDPSKIKWKDFDVDFVIEATGYFTSKNEAEAHLRAGAKRVIITAPSKDCPMFVCGVNLHKFKEEEKIVSFHFSFWGSH